MVERERERERERVWLPKGEGVVDREKRGGWGGVNNIVNVY